LTIWLDYYFPFVYLHCKNAFLSIWLDFYLPYIYLPCKIYICSIFKSAIIPLSWGSFETTYNS